MVKRDKLKGRKNNSVNMLELMINYNNSLKGINLEYLIHSPHTQYPSIVKMKKHKARMKDF